MEIDAPRLTKAQHEAWKSYTSPKWQPFKEAWMSRGLLWPPKGTGYDSDTESLRGLLWTIAEARPDELGEWVKRAPTPDPYVIVRYVLERWHSTQARKPEPVPETGPTREEARSALEHIRATVLAVTGIPPAMLGATLTPEPGEEATSGDGPDASGHGVAEVCAPQQPSSSQPLPSRPVTTPPPSASVLERGRWAVETEWHNGNISDSVRDRLLDALMETQP